MAPDNARECNFCERSPVECRELIEQESEAACVILDVRTHEEFLNGHLAGADNLDYFGSNFSSQLKKRDKNPLYIVYCQKGVHGSRTMDLMKGCEFCRVINIKGGFEGWKASGLPVQE